MTDAEKIEWLTATNKALMESQERLAGEVKELRKLLRHFFSNGGGIPYAQWTREQHAAYDILQKG